jgi:hypothetical protein
MARDTRAQVETLRLWHCPKCGYANAAKRKCAGCHKRSPRRVRINSKGLLEKLKGRRQHQ